MAAGIIIDAIVVALAAGAGAGGAVRPGWDVAGQAYVPPAEPAAAVLAAGTGSPWLPVLPEAGRIG